MNPAKHNGRSAITSGHDELFSPFCLPASPKACAGWKIGRNLPPPHPHTQKKGYQSIIPLLIQICKVYLSSCHPLKYDSMCYLRGKTLLQKRNSSLRERKSKRKLERSVFSFHTNLIRFRSLVVSVTVNPDHLKRAYVPYFFFFLSHTRQDSSFK